MRTATRWRCSRRRRGTRSRASRYSTRMTVSSEERLKDSTSATSPRRSGAGRDRFVATRPRSKYPGLAAREARIAAWTPSSARRESPPRRFTDEDHLGDLAVHVQFRLIPRLDGEVLDAAGISMFDDTGRRLTATDRNSGYQITRAFVASSQRSSSDSHRPGRSAVAR